MKGFLTDWRRKNFGPPPERLTAEASAQAGSGDGQFRSKNVRVELYNFHMNFDFILIKLPVIGFYFVRAYAFWQRNIAVANTSHVVLGFGLALLIFTRHKKWGWGLVLTAAVMHIIAFFA